MSDAVRTARRMTVEEFIGWDDGSRLAFELIDGRPEPRHIDVDSGRAVAPAAPSATHAAIVANAVGSLWSRLRPPCRAFSEVGIRPREGEDSFFVADVAVSCAPGPVTGWALPDPVFIVEVLSPGTAERDEGRKLADYCGMPSVCAVMLVQSREPGARLVRRVGDRWEIEFLRGTDAVAHVDALGLVLPMADLYRGVAFDGATGG